jgi:glucan phosphorylase
MTESVEQFLPSTRIAYVSMEIAIRPEIPNYAGGLGVLAGTPPGPAPTSRCRWSSSP